MCADENDDTIEQEAEQRYRDMIGADLPLKERAARSRQNATRVEPLESRTW